MTVNTASLLCLHFLFNASIKQCNLFAYHTRILSVEHGIRPAAAVSLCAVLLSRY